MDGNNGINQSDMLNNITLLNSYIEEMKSCMMEINSQMATLSSYYKGDNSNAIKKKYTDLSSQYASMYNKLSSYCDALNNNIIAYQDQNAKVSTYFSSQDSDI